jgi:hypothetical protein
MSEYIRIFIDWFTTTIVPLIGQNFKDLIDLVKDLFQDLIPSAE